MSTNETRGREIRFGPEDNQLRKALFPEEKKSDRNEIVDIETKHQSQSVQVFDNQVLDQGEALNV